MKISVRWLNQYLSPGDVTAAEAEHALTFAGFPIESTTPVPGGDSCLDVEVTSNRGDVLCHIGVAREIAAITGRTLRIPAPSELFGEQGSGFMGGPGVPPGSSDAPPVTLDNRVPNLCRLFTARVIRAVRVGPSPRWLVESLAAVGQRSINNVVDATNFIALECGQPTHVFDLATIGRAAGQTGKPSLIIRTALKGEKLKLLDGKAITLAGDELVVADPAHEGLPISLAGVMGGAETEVSGATTDVVLEAATWDPVSVRRAARRFNLRTDASHRFERTVDPRTVEPAARRAAALIALLAGGTPDPGAVAAGPSAPDNTPIRLRPARIAQMLGVPVSPARTAEILAKLEIAVTPGTDGALSCLAPPFRPDLTREIDLIEEVARINGLDNLPVAEKIAARIAPPQPTEAAMRELARVLTGLGFYEAVTFTFISEKAARPFIPKDLAPVTVCDERRKADPILRSSPIPSLLACRRANQDAGGDIAAAGSAGVRLYETSAVFVQHPPTEKGRRGREFEVRNLAMIADAVFPEGAKAFDRKQAAIRAVRGAIESLVRALGGAPAADALAFIPAPPRVSAYDPSASGRVMLNGIEIGVLGLIADALQREHDLAAPVAAAEVMLDPLLALFPPRTVVRSLPQFPSIERDLSLVVAEAVTWDEISALVAAAGPGQMERCWFVGAYRGQPIPAGKKSLTLRMLFRDPADQRTLRHEEVDPQVAGLVERAKRDLGAEVRV